MGDKISIYEYINKAIKLINKRNKISDLIPEIRAVNFY